jgi:hypothetical protein
MPKRKIVTVAILLAVVVIAVVGIELFVDNTLLGYSKITLTPYSYPPTSVKFGDTSYYILFYLVGKSDGGAPVIGAPPDAFFHITTEQTLIINSNQSFRAIQGAKYSFEGLRIVVGSVNVTSHQLILYVKSTISSSEPIISTIATPPISPLPTTYPSSPVPVSSPPPYIFK